VCLVLLAPADSRADQRVTVAWDPSADAGVAGYTLLYGTRSAQYSLKIDVGNRNQYEMPPLLEGTYYLAVQAYTAEGVRSKFSNEVTVSVTQDPVALRERSRADFNGDGMYDILWSNKATGQLATWMLDGENVKIEAGLSHSMPDLNWQVAGTGDFNSDGKPDIVWRHKLYGFVGVWLMKGVTCIGVVSFSTPRVADIGWKIAGIADFNRDGHADILWQHDTGPLALWKMNGITSVSGDSLGGHSGMAGDPRWRVVGVTDMNGDGHVDLLWRHSDGWVATWLLQGVQLAGVWSLNPVAEFDSAWQIVGTADVNLDGDQDILWQHATDGNVVVWYMDGITRTGIADVTGGSLGGADWKVVGPK
jgi:hypothetical protein